MNARAAIVAALEHAGGVGGLADLQRRWGLSRQRVWQLYHEPDEPCFPEPVAWVNSRPVFSLEECDRWRRSRLDSPRARAAVGRSGSGAGNGPSSRPVPGEGRLAPGAGVQPTARDEEDW